MNLCITGKVARRTLGAAVIITLGLLTSAYAFDGGGRAIGTLKGVPVPTPPDLSTYVADRNAAIALGKALFWDMQVGSDGVQACATCHFNAGADSRSKNQLNPRGGSFQIGGPDYQFVAANFPFHKLANPADRRSAVLSDTSNVSGSQGTFFTQFLDIASGLAQDLGQYVAPDIFSVNGVKVRRSTGRNTPTNINAVFNYRNFWDGRAQFEFNGVNPFGKRDPNAFVLQVNGSGHPQKTSILITNASLASQSVGPPNNGVEMAFDDPGGTGGRTWKKLGKKMLSLAPLATQRVAGDDSVLGSLSKAPNPGLSTSYAALIQAAFQPRWWNSTDIVDANGNIVASPTPGSTNEFTVMESNFSLFWGLAIQLYESTLVSDNSPFDQYMAGNRAALNSLEVKGMGVFTGKGGCANCHNGPELTDAAVSLVSVQPFSTIQTGSGANAISDTGFHNIGARLTGDDGGIAGSDPFGNPLSNALLTPQSKPVAVGGAFKTPSLRNIELEAPFFHNGGQMNLRQVVEFYSRGSDFADQNAGNFDNRVKNLGLNSSDMDALVAFLKSLTDARVRAQSAPFDHPELTMPAGQPGNQSGVTDSGNGNATQDYITIPATGKNGGAPLTTFCGSMPGPPACQ
jgi:cytochrome c peroxidase